MFDRLLSSIGVFRVDDRSHLFLSKLPYVFILYITLIGTFAHGALLALPSGESERINWERALVVYDRLSQQQTVIGEVSVSGSPSHFAILLATPILTVSYTTTRIWRKMRPYVSHRSKLVKSLKINPYSVILRALRTPPQARDQSEGKIAVLKSSDTQVHLLERDLHAWLIRRGLTLTPEQALSVKKVYREKFVITALHVKPRHQNSKKSPTETWTSSWVFTHEVQHPYYLYLSPTQLNLNGLETSMRTSEEEHKKRSSLKLSFLSDQSLAYQILPVGISPSESWLDKHQLDEWSGLLSTLGRVEISELNQTLSAQNLEFQS